MEYDEIQLDNLAEVTYSNRFGKRFHLF